ncbi:MAG: type II CRISPR RNA-guided endonuclease Cas9, partial [Bacteroidota bacterium]
LSKDELWKLRADAVNKQLTILEIGRVLIHLNQKRGYKNSRSEANVEKKDTEYVAIVKSRYEKLKESKQTIGQKFSYELSQNQFYRIKDQVFPREAYVEEYNLIMQNQQKFYPEIFTSELINTIRDEIIYYQRKLKSQKGLVAVCEFEGFLTQLNSSDKQLFVGPKVAPRSSPLFQISRIWETINNIKLRLKNGSDVEISIDKKKELFNYLDNNEKMSYPMLLKILDLKKDNVYGNKQLYNGILGNKNKTEIVSCFESPNSFEHLFKFDIEIITTEKEAFHLDKNSGEVINTKPQKFVSADVENQPYYKLWHTIYSISDKEECINVLIKKFSIPEDVALKISALDFTKLGFSNKSHRAIRKMLPYLMEGDQDYNARSYAGYYHTMAITKQEN